VLVSDLGSGVGNVKPASVGTRCHPYTPHCIFGTRYLLINQCKQNWVDKHTSAIIDMATVDYNSKWTKSFNFKNCANVFTATAIRITELHSSVPQTSQKY
jgi:hypothetical protein